MIGIRTSNLDTDIKMRAVSIKCKFNVFYTDRLMKVTESLAKK